jgi:trans-aconitate methyltransferase
VRFTTQPLQEILPLLKKHLTNKEKITFHVPDPDNARGEYAGSIVKTEEGITVRHRSLRAWMELAEILGCRMLLPQKRDDGFVTLTFEKIQSHSFHDTAPGQKTEKYGAGSAFSRIDKMEEPAFLHYYLQALQNVRIDRRRQILNLGINRGDEFDVIRRMLPETHYRQLNLTGIDHSHSAIMEAKARFSETNVTLLTHDINHLDTLKLGRFDLLISIGTLQSPGIAYKPFLMSLVQNHLTEDSALILGFPNSRWAGGEVIYGAKAPNYAMSEMSLLFNDVMFAKKYLQQKKYRVTITGKHYLFLTATKITSSINQK